MPGHATETQKAPADDVDGKMATFARSGMTGVQMAVVAHREMLRRQRGGQRGLDLLGRDAHGSPAGREAGSSAGASSARGSGFRCLLR